MSTPAGGGGFGFAPAKGLTPYQGVMRVMGEFNCVKCKNYWRSGASWRDSAQKCSGCLEYIFPFSQDPKRLFTSGPSNARFRPRIPPRATKPHSQENCEMCSRIGSSCMRVDVSNLLECRSCQTIWFRSAPADAAAECPACGGHVTWDDPKQESEFKCRCGHSWSGGYTSPDVFVRCTACSREVRPEKPIKKEVHRPDNFVSDALPKIEPAVHGAASAVHTTSLPSTTSSSVGNAEAANTAATTSVGNTTAAATTTPVVAAGPAGSKENPVLVVDDDEDVKWWKATFLPAPIEVLD